MDFSTLGFAQVPGYARRHRRGMTKALDRDLKKLKARAFDRAGWAEDVLRRYHSILGKLDGAVAQQLRGLYQDSSPARAGRIADAQLFAGRKM
jgi:hypothetical protein